MNARAGNDLEVLTGLVMARASAAQFLATAGDLEPVRGGDKPQAPAHLGPKPVYFVAVELHDPVAVLANNMIVVGTLGVIWIVILMVFSKIHLPDEPTFGEERKGAIDSCPRNGPIDPAGPFQEFVSREMLLGRENRLHDGLALGG